MEIRVITATRRRPAACRRLVGDDERRASSISSSRRIAYAQMARSRPSRGGENKQRILHGVNSIRQTRRLNDSTWRSVYVSRVR